MTEFNPLDYETRRHTCPLPDPGAFNAPRGWRCDCGKAYRRVSESQHGDAWFVWKRMPKADE